MIDKARKSAGLIVEKLVREYYSRTLKYWHKCIQIKAAAKNPEEMALKYRTRYYTSNPGGLIVES